VFWFTLDGLGRRHFSFFCDFIVHPELTQSPFPIDPLASLVFELSLTCWEEAGGSLSLFVFCFFFRRSLCSGVTFVFFFGVPGCGRFFSLRLVPLPTTFDPLLGSPADLYFLPAHFSFFGSCFFFFFCVFFLFVGGAVLLDQSTSIQGIFGAALCTPTDAFLVIVPLFFLGLTFRGV